MSASRERVRLENECKERRSGTREGVRVAKNVRVEKECEWRRSPTRESVRVEKNRE